MSFYSLQWNWLISAYLFQLMLQTSYLKSNAIINAHCNLCHKEQILVVARWILSYCPKTSTNATKYSSKSMIVFQIEE